MRRVAGTKSCAAVAGLARVVDAATIPINSCRRSISYLLFPDTKTAEDQVENVIVCGGAGDFIQRAKCVVKIEQKHFMRDLIVDGCFGIA